MYACVAAPEGEAEASVANSLCSPAGKTARSGTHASSFPARSLMQAEASGSSASRLERRERLAGIGDGALARAALPCGPGPSSVSTAGLTTICEAAACIWRLLPRTRSTWLATASSRARSCMLRRLETVSAVLKTDTAASSRDRTSPRSASGRMEAESADLLGS